MTVLLDDGGSLLTVFIGVMIVRRSRTSCDDNKPLSSLSLFHTNDVVCNVVSLFTVIFIPCQILETSVASFFFSLSFNRREFNCLDVSFSTVVSEC